MNIDTNSSSAFQNQRPDAKSYKWLWIIILSGLCICLIFAGSAIYKFFNQNEPQIYITTGKLDGTIYTNSDESFTCDFMNYITPDILLRDSTENGVGKIDLYNSVTSVNITVQYLIPSNDIQDLLNNQANYREGISALVENIDNDFKARFPNSNLLVSETKNDGNAFVVYIVPDARYSYFDNPTSNIDLLLGILIFAKNRYAYIMQAGFPLNNELQALSKDNQIDFVRKQIEDVSKICTFTR